MSIAEPNGNLTNLHEEAEFVPDLPCNARRWVSSDPAICQVYGTVVGLFGVLERDGAAAVGAGRRSGASNI